MVPGHNAIDLLCSTASGPQHSTAPSRKRCVCILASVQVHGVPRSIATCERRRYTYGLYMRSGLVAFFLVW